jgi:hypothetical protein
VIVRPNEMRPELDGRGPRPMFAWLSTMGLSLRGLDKVRAVFVWMILPLLGSGCFGLGSWILPKTCKFSCRRSRGNILLILISPTL